MNFSLVTCKPGYVILTKCFYPIKPMLQPELNYIMMMLLQLSSENEATVMRLEEQAKILKEEIRRLERNQQREKEAANMEYLKNILLKVRMMSLTRGQVDS